MVTNYPINFPIIDEWKHWTIYFFQFSVKAAKVNPQLLSLLVQCAKKDLDFYTITTTSEVINNGQVNTQLG